ncbi:MAG: DivIVA domain-containing protein [Defluviitaleaceae bacterium]|nr:DivIVA domain-containing protein [Defluviitaleaceae bacterium]
MEQFTYVKRGYDPEEVDRYIATLEQVIKSYKEKDNAIKNAIISAQIAADNMVKNARAQADEYKGQISAELDKLSAEVGHQRMKIKAFQDVYSGMVRKYLTDLNDNDMGELHNKLDDVDRFISRLKEMDIVPTSSPYDEATPDSPSSPPPAPTLKALPKPPPPPQQKSQSKGAQQKADQQPISLGPSTSPSLNKTEYAPPQAAARINEDGNYVPST